jgi:hypothetical protein
MLSKCRLLCIAITLILVMLTGRSFAQKQNVNFDPLLEQIRADLRADKVAIITAAMGLRPADADRFWPVYRKYAAEVSTLNDERIKLLVEYDQKSESLTDAQAKKMVDSYFDWEIRRTQLRKNYFPEFVKATSAMTAAKFFQVEHRIDLLVDLQIAADLPRLFLSGNTK